MPTFGPWPRLGRGGGCWSLLIRLCRPHVSHDIIILPFLSLQNLKVKQHRLQTCRELCYHSTLTDSCCLYVAIIELLFCCDNYDIIIKLLMGVCARSYTMDAGWKWSFQDGTPFLCIFAHTLVKLCSFPNGFMVCTCWVTRCGNFLFTLVNKEVYSLCTGPFLDVYTLHTAVYNNCKSQKRLMPVTTLNEDVAFIIHFFTSSLMAKVFKICVL